MANMLSQAFGSLLPIWYLPYDGIVIISCFLTTFIPEWTYRVLEQMCLPWKFPDYEEE